MLTRRAQLISVAMIAILGSLATSCTDDSEWGGPGAAAAGIEAQLAQIVDDGAARDDVAGVIAAVRFGDGSEWVHTAGAADVETGAPIDEAMTWPIRSITKSFAITVLLQLVDEGVVSLDDTVDEYVAGVPGGDRVTLGQLALMSSGLPEYANEAFVDDFVDDTDRVFTDEELLAYTDGEESLFEPGAEHVYTNTNTLLLGMVLSDATGTPIAELISERLLVPLALDATSYAPEVSEVRDDVPTGHAPDGDGGLGTQPLTFGVFGASGAMASTVEDLLDWGQVLGAGSEISAASHDERLGSATPLDGGPEYDAYGLGIGELDGWWGHTGDGLGYTTLVMYDPDSATTVVILVNVTNLDEHLPTSLFREVVPVLERADGVS